MRDDGGVVSFSLFSAVAVDSQFSLLMTIIRPIYTGWPRPVNAIAAPFTPMY